MNITHNKGIFPGDSKSGVVHNTSAKSEMSALTFEKEIRTIYNTKNGKSGQIYHFVNQRSLTAFQWTKPTYTESRNNAQIADGIEQTDLKTQPIAKHSWSAWLMLYDLEDPPFEINRIMPHELISLVIQHAAGSIASSEPACRIQPNQMQYISSDDQQCRLGLLAFVHIIQCIIII